MSRATLSAASWKIFDRMTPEQFLTKITKQRPAAVYLFIGPEAYQRRICKDALLDKLLPGESRGDGFTRVDMEETSLAEILDDARSLSLFAADRMIWVASAESALPRRLSNPSGGEDAQAKSGTEGLIAPYLKAPTPGTVIVFECSRFGYSGDDKAKLDRVAKFYSGIPDVVEFRPFTPESIRYLAQELIQREGIKVGTAELAFLLDAIGGDASRLSSEIEKLSLFVGKERRVTLDDLRAVVPNASQSNIFSLVSALGKGDRPGALKSLDLLVRDGEYLPLALTFLGTQFRLALTAREVGLRNAPQAISYFGKQGIRMWRDRAEQVLHTASALGEDRLKTGLSLIYAADKGLRDARPDDRTVMESLVLRLTR
jgi:DNA polymerase III subunit delta